VNNWNDEYERVFLGGMTCDSDDYYNSEQHINAIYLPKYQEERRSTSAISIPGHTKIP
jgi:arginine decarboxylase